MKRKVAAAVVALGGWVIACVGDDPGTSSGPQPDPNVPVGQFRGACTSDGKCIEGLVCTQGVCLQREDGGASTTDGGGGGSGDAASDGDGEPPPCTYQNEYSGPIKCSNATCSTSSPCCMGASGTVACEPSCPVATSPKLLACDTSAQCMSGTDATCCVRIKAPVNRFVCPHPVAWADFAESVCTSVCGGTNEYYACRKDADCDVFAKKCSGVELSNGSDKISFGICL